MPADNEIIARLVPEQGVRAELNTYYLYDKIDPQTVIDALGYVPYDATNPAGYEANTIDSISVNGVEQQITNKNVDITVPDSLPPQEDNAGKFLTTNGTTALWASLATVATTGSYADLINKPTIPAAQVNSDWNASSGVAEILNKPNLANVATTGEYDDLLNKPTIPAAQVQTDWNATSGMAEILNKPTLSTVATSGSYTDLINKPTIPDTTNMQVTTNLVTSVSSASTDTQYPSAKLFYDTCGDIETLINAL